MAFITQDPSQKYSDYAKDDTVGDIEVLVSGVTQTSQSTLLLKKRKEMREVDDALEFMKQEFKSRMDACNCRQKEFEFKQQEMKEQVTRFEKFVQENDAKRSRAEAKAKMEQKLSEQNEVRIQSLKETLLRMQNEREKLQEDLNKLKKYQKFLEETVDFSEREYDEIPDILNRYKTLEGANEDLKVLVEKKDAENDIVRAELNQLRSETQNALLVNNSEIHACQKMLEHMREQAFKRDSEREQEEKFTKDRHRESGQVIMSIKNLYNRCLETSRAKTKPLHFNDKQVTPIDVLTESLNVIRYRLTDLELITTTFTSKGAGDGAHITEATPAETAQGNKK